MSGDRFRKEGQMQKLDERLLVTIAQQDWLDRTASTVQDVVRKLFAAGDAARVIRDLLHGTWLAHPLHAVTTDVAIGGWTTAQVLDAVDSRNRIPNASTVAVAVGLGGAVASAASGLADWSETESDQKRLGLVHATVNVTAVILYSASLISRMAGNHGLGKLLGGAGFTTVLVGSYLGGDLAYRLGSQVDRNAWTKTIRDFAPAMREADLVPEKPTWADVKGVRVMLLKRGERIFALGDTCAHQGCSLSRGRVDGETIVCACHGSTYRLEDGSVVHGPAVYGQPSFDVRVIDGQVEIKSVVE